MRFPQTLFAFCGVVGLALGAGARADAPIYWGGRSGGCIFRWTARDLSATHAATGRRTYSVVSTLRREFGKLDPEDVMTYYEVTFAPLSIVGSLLSYERDDAWDGGAHPSGNETFGTIDVRSAAASKRPVKLTDLFPAREIRAALLADPLVRRVLAREKIAPPATLNGLIKALANKNFGGEEDAMYQFPESLLQDFAFHHVENGKVAVRFLLPHGAEIFRFQHTQLGILLPIPAHLQTAFAQAATGKAGALMPALKRAGAGRNSSLVLVEGKNR